MGKAYKESLGRKDADFKELEFRASNKLIKTSDVLIRRRVV